MTATPTADRRAVLVGRVRMLVGATIAYNIVEAALALAAGAAADSSALLGFGLDSVVEVSSAAAVAWQFSARDPAVRDAREQRTLRIIACAFYALAVVVTTEAARALLSGQAAQHSRLGIGLAAVSVVVMPVLSLAQRRTGRQLGSASAVADSSQTMLCTYLSAVLLLGLLANAALGWGWADPVAALVIAVVALREGRQAWRGDQCCTPVAALHPAGEDDRPTDCDCCG